MAMFVTNICNILLLFSCAKAQIIYEAEEAEYYMASITQGRNVGYSGIGYVDMGGQGSYVIWTSVDGGNCGGTCTFKIRYTNGGSTSRPCEVKLNGIVVGNLSFAVTNSWSNYQYSDTIVTQCAAGLNSIQINASTGAGGPNLDLMDFSSPVCTTEPTHIPTSYPSKSPTNNPTQYPTQLTLNPSQFPTKTATNFPTQSPTYETSYPSVSPSNNPSVSPTDSPTNVQFVTTVSMKSNAVKTQASQQVSPVFMAITISIIAVIATFGICVAIWLYYVLDKSEKGSKDTKQIEICMTNNVQKNYASDSSDGPVAKKVNLSDTTVNSNANQDESMNKSDEEMEAMYQTNTETKGNETKGNETNGNETAGKILGGDDV